MFWAIFTLVWLVLAAISIYVQYREKKERERTKPKPTKTTMVSVLNPQHIEEFIQKYDAQFTENEEYRYKEPRLKDEFYGEKVYRYRPAYLPLRIEGNDVYSKLDDWVKVGELSEEIDGDPTLLLYINEYKDVKNLEIKKVKGDPYYVLKVVKML